MKFVILAQTRTSSMFSCCDNGGFLAELYSDLRIETFTSLIMVNIRVVGVGRLSAGTKNAINSFVQRIFANS